MYTQGFLYLWHRAVQQVTAHLRDDVLLPLDGARGGSAVFDDVKSGVALPSWHGPFYVDAATKTPCRACARAPDHQKNGAIAFEKELWAHVRAAHGRVLRDASKRWGLCETGMSDPEVQLTLLNGAVAEKE